MGIEHPQACHLSVDQPVTLVAARDVVRESRLRGLNPNERVELSCMAKAIGYDPEQE